MKGVKIVTVTLLSLSCAMAKGQAVITLEQAIQLALKNNPAAKAASLEIEHERWLKKSSVEIPKTNVMLTYGQYNSVVRNDNNISVSQTIPFPTVWSRSHAVGNALVKSGEYHKASIENDLAYQVSSVYYQLLYLKAKNQLLTLQDSLLERLSKAAGARYAAGEINLLVKTSAETHWNEVKNQLLQNKADISIQHSRLMVLTQSPSVTGITGDLERIPESAWPRSLSQNPELKYTALQVDVARARKKLEIARIMPEITVGYFNQTLIGYQNVNAQEQYFGSSSRFQGFQAGLTIPLWFTYHRARARATATEHLIAQQNLQSHEQHLTGLLEQARLEYEKAASSIEYYRSSALPNANAINSQAEAAFKNGEIDYTNYLVNLQSATAIQNGYLDALLLLHQSSIQLDYLTGNHSTR
jgi:cobalt-zinc-cadmium resistance protein CzcA